jgi:hypothetical protein
MRRVISFYEYKIKWWRERREGLGCIWPSEDHAEGAHAYGSEHAAMHEALITRCKIVWARKNKFTTQFTEAIPEASNDQASDVPVDDTVYEYNEDIV